MRQLMKGLGLVLGPGLGVILAGFSPACAESMIDDFGAPGSPEVLVILLQDPNPSLVQTADSGILGDERDLLIEVDSNAPDVLSFMGRVGGGVLKFVSSSPGTTATLQYDGNDTADSVGPPAALVNSDGLGGENLYLLGDQFRLDFGYIEGGPLQATDLKIEVNSAESSAAYTGEIPDSSGTTGFPVLFTDFLGGDPFGAATSIVFYLNPDDADGVAPNVNFELDQIVIAGEPIPEPSTLWMLAGGLLGLLVYLRRRRR